MTYYVAKPIPIEAWKVTFDEDATLPQWVTEAIQSHQLRREGYSGVTRYRVHNKHTSTWLDAMKGDWIIKGTDNEYYPCVDHVFKLKYEAMDG